MEALKKLTASGLVQRWVKERDGNWNHDDWLAFLKLAVEQCGEMPADAVGELLEAEKKRYLEARERKKINRKQWRILGYVFASAVLAVLGWRYYNPRLISLLAFIAPVASSLYRRASRKDTSPIELRTWTIIFVVVVGLPIYVVIARWEIFQQLLMFGPPPVQPADRFLIAAVGVVNGIAFALTYDLLKTTFQYHIHGKGDKPDPQPVHVWVIAVVTFVIGLLFTALAASAPPIKN